MATAQHGHRRTRLGYAWWRPAAYSAAAAAAVAALFNPLPALADPSTGQATVPGAVPDSGSRPIPAGALVLPGQSSVTTTTPITTSALSGTTNPTLQKIQNGRDEISTLGDQLIQLGQVRTSAKSQQASAEQQYTQAENDLRTAQTTAADAASQDMLEAAAMPAGAFDSGLLGLDDLAHTLRGQGGSSEAAARQLEQAQIAAQIALDAQNTAETAYTAANAQYTKLNAEIARKQTAQQKLENANQSLLSAAEATENAANTQLGNQYLAGAEAGRGADPRAVQALDFALAQRGKPYVWSTEGPSTYDCSGLMYASYGSVGFQLMRVSRDQYWQTRNKVVDRYSLLPGDLLFFSYSNSWRGIHHVAMYAGDGMMVEAPRTGLNVRLVPVRWTELFQATRVFGSVDGTTTGPVLGAPDPQPTETTPTSTHSTSPTHTTSPTHSTSPKPTHSTSPSGSPSPSPSHTTTPTPTPTTPTPTPTTPTPTTDPPPTTTSPAPGPSDSGGTASGSTSPATDSPSATKSSSASASTSKSSSSAGAN
jgi:cell wall-associated NlpC family hydrolase